jgi:cell wall-associated NlpC family hydrolase
MSESIQRFLAGTLPAGSQPADAQPHKIADMLMAPVAPAAVPATASAPGTAQPAGLMMPPVPTKGASALSAAMAAMGTPYRWGGTGRGGFDCSGLAQWAYRKAGITLPRSSRAQSGVGTPVSRADLQPGDLVFFYRPVSHVGIYVGNGNVVHAPQTGDVVKISPISRMPFAGARRL